MKNMLVFYLQSATFKQQIKSQDKQLNSRISQCSNGSGGYKKQDGVFTALVDGVYVFFCKITQAINRVDMVFQFNLNGSAQT